MARPASLGPLVAVQQESSNTRKCPYPELNLYELGFSYAPKDLDWMARYAPDPAMGNQSKYPLE
jgi:hypothetical protein